MITIPSQHYVGIKPERETESSLPLAFATPYGTDSAFEKRKNTINQWCRGYGKYVDGKYVYPEFEAKVHDNVLLDGFRIAESVRRIGWNGGNVVWRIVDPRGFELEISSANFARIIDCTTIENGEIKGKCIWGRDGAANVLLPESSEPYKQAAANTQRASMKIDAKTLAVGDEVEFKDGQIWVYLGQYSVVSRKENRITASLYGGGTSYQYTIDVKKRHIFGCRIDKSFAVANDYRMQKVGKVEGDLRYYIVSDTKKVASIVKKDALVVDPTAVASDITKQFEQYSNVIESASTDSLAFAVIPGNVKLTDLTLSLEPAVAGTEFVRVTNIGGVWFYLYETSCTSKYNLCSVTADLTKHTYTQSNRVTQSIDSIDNVDVYNFVVTHKGNQYRF